MAADKPEPNFTITLSQTDRADIKRVEEYLLEQIIETDRKLKTAENDQEASFEEHLQQLRAVGFGHVVPVFLEARYGGIVACK